jgi:beta-xylosidase
MTDLGDGTYRNPVLHADWSDPDCVRVGGEFVLTASSFAKVPGLPILTSPDLVNWTIVGPALTRQFPEPRPGCGVWAPALRHHAGRLRIYYGDPDRGIFVVTAVDPAGPWSEPHLVKAGRGLIDPCPFWDTDGRAYLIHAWAKSRAGVNNRLTLHRMDPDGDRLLDSGVVVVDGDLLPGYRTLEGPKLYRRDGWYWIFAPAGGVARGWQSAFRSRHIAGPYEHRIVLAQGDTDVNGPHQGAWVGAPDGGDWFLHFQDRGAYGRVVHLQPMAWTADGWPDIGHSGQPVDRHRKPVPGWPARSPQTADDFAGPDLGPQWSWTADPDPTRWEVGGGRLRLACRPGPVDLRARTDVLTQRLPAETFTARTTVRVSDGGRAGLAVLGDSYAWLGLADSRLVYRTAGPDGPTPGAAAAGPERDLVAPVPMPGGVVEVAVEVSRGALCRFLADGRQIGAPFRATPGHWVGAVLALFSAGVRGWAEFGPFRVRS